MTKYFKYMVLFLALVQIASCREPYDPAIKPGKNGYLVVDGVIVNGKSETLITLTRTMSLHDLDGIIYEQNADVKVEGEDNTVFALTEKANGQYSADSLDLLNSVKYRLKIITADGNTYASDFVPVLASPPIDSVSWTQEKDPARSQLYNFHIFVSTHNPQNNTKYYLWNYEETWKYHAPVKSYVGFIGDTIMYISRPEQDKLYYCWQSERSKSILIGNTVKLSQDVISMQPLTSVQGNLLKKSFVYSINVKQYALTQQAYQFYEIVQKNTEQTGSFFDPQPSEISGNIKNTNDPSELVIGYISISTLAEKRIFIDQNMIYLYGAGCDLVNFNNLDASRISYPTYFPVDYIIDRSTSIITGYVLAPRECVDCERLGGKNVKPVFWPDSL
jgi:hypothetical protein